MRGGNLQGPENRHPLHAAQVSCPERYLRIPLSAGQKRNRATCTPGKKGKRTRRHHRTYGSKTQQGGLHARKKGKRNQLPRQAAMAASVSARVM